MPEYDRFSFLCLPLPPQCPRPRARGLKPDWISDPKVWRTEVLAGLVVALALIPEAISFSIIAGVDPALGLFASFTMAVTISIVGGRRAMISAATGAVALHLLITGAGHLLVAGVTALGILLAPALSEVATEAVLVGAGRDRDVVVTAVAHEPTGNPAYYCSVRLRDGAPVGVRLWRGCGPAVEPGDVIGMVYDPEGRVGPRGIDGAAPLLRGLGETAALLLAFAALCLLAVVRSYRVSSAGSSHPRG